jgi:hypothetical protein
MPTEYKYSAKVYELNPNTLVVQQTVMKTGSRNYIIDRKPDGSPKNRIINIKDDGAISEAIRHALTGNL